VTVFGQIAKSPQTVTTVDRVCIFGRKLCKDIFKEVFEMKTKQALAVKDASKKSNDEYEVQGIYNKEYCLLLPPFSNSAPSDVGNFFCKDDLFDEMGRVKMFTGYLNSCEHLKLNKTFILEHGLFDYDAKEANWVIQNYQQPEINYTKFWSNFVSGWKINDDLRDSGMKLCIAEPAAYNIVYCLPRKKDGDFEIRIMDPAANT
jgi:hypothetical protein